jgi:hypothetical protein
MSFDFLKSVPKSLVSAKRGDAARSYPGVKGPAVAHRLSQGLVPTSPLQRPAFLPMTVTDQVRIASPPLFAPRFQITVSERTDCRLLVPAKSELVGPALLPEALATSVLGYLISTLTFRRGRQYRSAGDVAASNEFVS